jgi:hypothetical protein
MLHAFAVRINVLVGGNLILALLTSGSLFILYMGSQAMLGEVYIGMEHFLH